MNIGSVNAVPRPGSQTMEEALNLLAAFGGGDKKNRKLLEEMKAVQVHNEEIYKQAHAAIHESSALAVEAKRLNGEARDMIKDELSKVRIHESDLQLREDDVKEQELAFDTRVNQFGIEQANAKSRLSQREKAVTEAGKKVAGLKEAAERQKRQAEIFMEANLLKKAKLESIAAELAAPIAKLKDV